MELDLQSLFGLHVHTAQLHSLAESQPETPATTSPSPPAFGWAHIRERYWSAKIDDIP